VIFFELVKDLAICSIFQEFFYIFLRWQRSCPLSVFTTTVTTKPTNRHFPHQRLSGRSHRSHHPRSSRKLGTLTVSSLGSHHKSASWLLHSTNRSQIGHLAPRSSIWNIVSFILPLYCQSVLKDVCRFLFCCICRGQLSCQTTDTTFGIIAATVGCHGQLSINSLLYLSISP
jgi:hypothetical protein